MRTIIPVENNDALAAVRGFLKQLLAGGVVDALLVPMETPAGTVTPALVSDPAMLDAANPLAPVMGLNAARVAGRVSIREPRGRIGVVLRSCELRALVELVKLQQASLEDVVTIGVDCLGTYDVPVYTAMQADGGVDMAALLATAQSGELVPQKGAAAAQQYAFRDACQMCEKPHVSALLRFGRAEWGGSRCYVGTLGRGSDDRHPGQPARRDGPKGAAGVGADRDGGRRAAS